jgi:cytochrome c oxidase subunit 2
MINLKNFISILFFLFYSFGLKVLSLSDASVSWQLTFQEPATPIMEGIINFHNHIMFFIVGIAIFVGWLLSRCLAHFSATVNADPVDNFTHATTVEIVWTIVPAIILLFIAVPSFSLLYSMDEVVDPAVTLKVIGHQWYWSYEYSDYNHLTEENTGINFDSYMLADDDLSKGNFRLLEVDNRVVLPVNTHIRVLITAADVLHSWAVPSFGVKVDACPGRLNQTTLFVNRLGTFYGQCSEICGVNHGFMPIAVDVVELPAYVEWLETKLEV